MSLSENSTVLVVEVVGDRDRAARELRQLPSCREGHNLAPLVDRRHSAAGGEDSRDSSTAPKMRLGGLGKHEAEAYSMLECKLKDAVGLRAYDSRPMETMGQRIKRLREARGWTQSQLAELTGVTVSAVSQWELDQTENVKLVPFLRLSKVLETDPHYLVFGPERGAEELSKPVLVRPRRSRSKS